MKISLLFLVVFLFVVNQYNCKKEKLGVDEAICQILNLYYVTKDRRVDILCFENDKKSLDMVNKIAKCHQNEAISFKIYRRVVHEQRYYMLTHSTIMIFENYRDYVIFHNKAIWKAWTNTNNLYHLIYIRSKQDFIFPLTNTYMNNNYLVGNGLGTELSLATVKYNVGPECSEKIETINRFTMTTKRWENQTFFPAKFADNNGCSKDFGFYDVPSNMYWRYDNFAKDPYLAGFMYHINEAITNKLNIQAKYYRCFADRNQAIKCKESSAKPITVLHAIYVNVLDSRSRFVNLEFFDFEHKLGFYIPSG
jgi:hypothetical protein